METKKLIGHLEDLVHLDIDATHAYGQAIEKIDDHNSDIKARLTEYKGDHERHVQELSQAIEQLGGQRPKLKRDFKGFLIESFTSLRSATGTKGALKAMKSNEDLTNKKYEKALSWEMPEDVRQVILRNREDERRHLEFILSTLERMDEETPVRRESQRGEDRPGAQI